MYIHFLPLFTNPQSPVTNHQSPVTSPPVNQSTHHQSTHHQSTRQPINQSTLYEAFSTLTPAEVKAFGKFVRSPYFNGKQQVTALFDFLVGCRDKKNVPDRKAAFSLIFPGETYNDLKLRLLMTALLGLLEQFWVREAQGAATADHILLARIYRERNLPKHFSIALREARKYQEEQPFRDADYYQRRIQIEWEQYQFDTANRRADRLNLQETSDLMDCEFISRKLRLACLALSHQAVYNAHYTIHLLPTLLTEVSRFPDEPAIGLYYHCYKFLSDAEPFEYFRQFLEVLPRYASALPEEELRIVHLLAINFGIKRINESRREWLEATLELYRSALDRGLLLENGRISRFAFNNVVAIALRVDEVDWAEAFIHQYKPLLERRYREASADLNLARVAYARRDYRSALLHLQRADYSDVMNNLTAKTLQLKIYYETGEYDLLDSHLKSMTTFINRHTAIGYHRTNYSRIVYYTRRLMNLKPAETADLRKKVAEEPVLSERVWLLEMLSV